MTVTKTTNFGLIAVYNEIPSAYDWAAIYWNWIFTDKLLYAAAVSHKHDGVAGISNPIGTLILSTSTGDGLLSSGRTYYFVITYLDDSLRETAASGIVSITTPAAISPPATPTNNDTATPTDIQSKASGLESGEYWYKISYLKSTGESVSSLPLYVNLPVGDTYECTIHFVSLTAAANGADSIRVYRRKGVTGSYVKVIDITSTSQNSYTDDNTAVVACDVRPKTVSTIDSDHAITIDWSGLDWTNAYKVRIYVTTTSGSYPSNAYITEIAMSDSTPITSYEWLGNSTSAGKPPEITQTYSSPSKILLTDGAEVQGSLPWANLPSNFTWGEPVVSFASLPTGIAGEARIVLDEDLIYIWDVDAATPLWKKISSLVEAYDYLDGPTSTEEGEFWLQETEDGLYKLYISDPYNFGEEILLTRDIGDESGYYGRFDPEMQEEFVPLYGASYGLDYGATRFNWSSKRFEYWDSNIATPAWIEV